MSAVQLSISTSSCEQCANPEAEGQTAESCQQGRNLHHLPARY